MDAEFWALVALVSGLIGVGASVFTVLFARRGLDAELRGDVDELALLVDRIQKSQRREKMARVRKGGAQGVAEQPVEVGQPAATKEQLRAVLAARGIGR